MQNLKLFPSIYQACPSKKTWQDTTELILVSTVITGRSLKLGELASPRKHWLRLREREQLYVAHPIINLERLSITNILILDARVMAATSTSCWLQQHMHTDPQILTLTALGFEFLAYLIGNQI